MVPLTASIPRPAENAIMFVRKTCHCEGKDIIYGRELFGKEMSDDGRDELL